jgi:hypothetical protein
MASDGSCLRPPRVRLPETAPDPAPTFLSKHRQSVLSTPSSISWSKPANGLPSRDNLPRKLVVLRHHIEFALPKCSTQLFKIRASSASLGVRQILHWLLLRLWVKCILIPIGRGRGADLNCQFDWIWNQQRDTALDFHPGWKGSSNPGFLQAFSTSWDYGDMQHHGPHSCWVPIFPAPLSPACAHPSGIYPACIM